MGGLVCAVLVAACSSSSSEGEGTTSRARGTFQAGTCDMPLPAGLVAGENVRCGRLVVPMSRKGPGTRTVSLSVMILRDASVTKPDPLVHLIGGPGGSYLAYGDTLAGDFGLGLSRATGRELVFFDQRGTGYSTPTLTCGETEELPVCLARLANEGVDVAAFNTEESAEDIEDLRVALGYQRVNLYGQSYGTLLALAFMRLHPGSVRSAVLESTSSVPHDALFSNSPKALELALGRVFAECRSDASCAAAFPQPEKDLSDLLAFLEEQKVDPSGVVKLLSTLTQLADGTSYVPLLLRAAVQGDEAALGRVTKVAEAYGERQARSLQGFAPLMNMAMNCYDYGPLQSVAQDERVNGSAPPAFRAALGVDVASELGKCASLPPSRTSEAQRAPVGSAVPTLLLAGTHDSNTPLEVAKATAATLPNSHLVELAGWGHVILPLGNACAREVTAEFLTAPEAKPRAACTATTRAKFALE